MKVIYFTDDEMSFILKTIKSTIQTCDLYLKEDTKYTEFYKLCKQNKEISKRIEDKMENPVEIEEREGNYVIVQLQEKKESKQ